MKNGLYITLGTLSVLMGILGLAVPGLPTTPFLLLAAYLFSMSSPRLHERLVRSRVLGRFIRDCREKGGISCATRVSSIAVMWVMIALSWIFFVEATWLKALLAAAGLTGTIVMGFIVKGSGE